jgi:4-amino-4-deoxy-L-arabinose transferase-like glycosyltransferase
VASDARASTGDSWPPGIWGPLALVLVALAVRLAVLSASRPANISPDAAHFLNIARCVSRGEGFSNPAAWPAWLAPGRLPAPETFKDPGYPYAIAGVGVLTGDLFLAGQLVSLLAGVLLPLALYRLARRLTGDRTVALVAALLTAGSPELIAQSVRVMSESLFTLLLVLALAVAAPDPARPRSSGARGWTPDLLAGGLLGLAFLTREQALIALPALALLLGSGQGLGPAGARAGRALLAMAAVASPLLVRNLQLFGAPLHSDAASFAVWPFVDPITFSHATHRPPAPLPFLAAHAPEVIGHALESLARFLRVLPRDLVGHVVWAPALAVGLGLALLRWRTWAFAWAWLVPAVLAMAVVSWNTRYFASTTPLWCLLTAVGARWLAARVGFRWPLAVRVFAASALLGLIALQTLRARRQLEGYAPPEIAAAIAEGPALAARLAPGEALMAVTTSYWSWFADRPSVHLPITDAAELQAIVRRYRVRLAALPSSRLAELAARYPGRRLPAILVPDHADPARDVTVFAVRDSAGP